MNSKASSNSYSDKIRAYSSKDYHPTLHDKQAWNEIQKRTFKTNILQRGKSVMNETVVCDQVVNGFEKLWFAI